MASFEIIKGIQAKPLKVVIYGVEGIGKSTLASQFPDPLFIDTEGSTARMSVSRYPRPTSYEMLKQEISAVINEKPCQTLIIDTFDWVEKMAVEDICARSQKTSITSFGYGDGFVQLEEEIGKLLNKLTEVTEKGINVVVTAHAQIKAFTQPDADNSYDRYEMKLGNKTTAKTSSLLKEWSDMVLFLNYKTFVVATDNKGTKHKATGGQRVMYTTHNPAWDAKNRFGLPEELPLSFDSIAHLFNGKAAAGIEEKVKDFFGKDSVEVVNDIPVPEASIPPSLNSVWVPEPYSQEEQTEMQKYDPRLVDLMKANNVHANEIEWVAADQKGYMPNGQPLSEYPKDFVEQWIIPFWSNIMTMITQKRDETLPF